MLKLKLTKTKGKVQFNPFNTDGKITKSDLVSDISCKMFCNSYLNYDL